VTYLALENINIISDCLDGIHTFFAAHDSLKMADGSTMLMMSFACLALGMAEPALFGLAEGLRVMMSISSVFFSFWSQGDQDY
jgi:hypothetical protein